MKHSFRPGTLESVLDGAPIRDIELPPRKPNALVFF
jgi:hypothetical protein